MTGKKDPNTHKTRSTLGSLILFHLLQLGIFTQNLISWYLEYKSPVDKNITIHQKYNTKRICI